MSKVGKKIIEIPQGVNVTIEGEKVKVTGPKGNLEVEVKNGVKVELKDNTISVLPKNEDDTQFQGLYRTLISNAVKGVYEGFTKKLEFNGIGYKATVQGGNLVLNVGYSHPVTIEKIDGIDFAVNDNVISVSGINNILVGDVAAKIRAVRPPEPYKGKGIKYVGEYIIRKEAKS